ncbi:hypothetical protein Pint_26174 [Pistacia integerrima]|uniref:Uncharacterized protein n=1 Tax=Pistacia integerrima TaxID=434235 RepID=A0ACC0YDK6_9ROSI|nr:hypothetical protein Pint_26174 [Pistacia integerrima]
MNCLFFFIFLISFLLSQSPTLSFHLYFCWRFRVHIINNLSLNNLVIHCFSYDDDLGRHELWWGEEFTFKIGQRAVGDTRVQCNVTKFGSNHITSIDVFTNGIADKHCCKTRQCYWSARDDAIYFSNNDKNWNRWYNWTSV